jgi:N-formylglutamate amidohydrolase
VVLALVLSFSVTHPRGKATPLVVEVPHAGLGLDPVALATLAAQGRSLGSDADLYVDELYADAPDEGAALIASKLSRYVCDLNRSADDVDPLAVEGGAARSSPHGCPALFGPISRAEYERRVAAYHRPYHEALAKLLEERRAQHGFAILLCAHSMPSRGRDGHEDAGVERVERADIVPGTRGKTTAAPLVIETVERLARSEGLRLVHDEPYKGGFTTQEYGRPKSGWHTIQIELARRLYMDERTLERQEGSFDRVRAFCRKVVVALGALDLS